ncbi:NAD(P)-binding domain-containing protein [Micromonospora sp. AMSO12t]|uniref:NAD(P)-binding domain-containing protein n=1 Tax=unclassified Micromonospora TaxID=2617518 RepID=UPI001CEC0D42|nr:NAD(P)-binding domain-containing protein [Micromonospora sp. AMSO12t]
MLRQESEDFPTAGHVADYLRAYELRYDRPVHRPVRAQNVRRAGERLAVQTDAGEWLARYRILRGFAGPLLFPTHPDFVTKQQAGNDDGEGRHHQPGQASPCLHPVGDLPSLGS